MDSQGVKHPSNVEGRFFVTTACTHCGNCQRIAPLIFFEHWKTRRGGAFIGHQPENQQDVNKCLRALEECPSNAIVDTANISSAVKAALS